MVTPICCDLLEILPANVIVSTQSLFPYKNFARLHLGSTERKVEKVMTTTTYAEFYRKALLPLVPLDHFFGKHQLVGIVHVDHIGYKCASADEFESMRRMLEPESVFMYQSVISHRRIAIIKLKIGFRTALGACTYLELSDQKPDMSQESVFDHAEIYPIAGGEDALVLLLTQKGITLHKVVKPHHTTHNVDMGAKFVLKLCAEPLIEKIKREEMKP